VLIAGLGGDAAARRARDEADLQEERLDDFLEGAALLGERRRDGPMPTGPPSKRSQITER
jgi:hypothetical protein